MNRGIVKPRTYGRMGNFLFQAAAAMTYAWKHGMEYTLPSVTNDPKWNPIYLQQLVKPWTDDGQVAVVIEEKSHAYQSLPFEEAWRHRLIILDGYWQSEKYFKGYRDAIIKEFGFQWKAKTGFVSVHVRRGDYLTVKRGGILKHPTVTKAWIESQMAKFKGMQFMFFSDDLDWCEQEFVKREDCHFHRGPTEEADLVGMSWCEHQICSASTFSWWAAWLNRNPAKRIIMPNHWLTPGWGPDCSDIVPPGWERA